MSDDVDDPTQFWDHRDNNPSWHIRPWSIYMRVNKYELYRLDEFIGTFDSFEAAAADRTRIMKHEIRRMRESDSYREELEKPSYIREKASEAGDVGSDELSYFYGNDSVYAFLRDPMSEGPSIGAIWVEDEDGVWYWADLPGHSKSIEISCTGNYDRFPFEKLETAMRLSEQRRAEIRAKIAEEEGSQE